MNLIGGAIRARRSSRILVDRSALRSGAAACLAIALALSATACKNAGTLGGKTTKGGTGTAGTTTVVPAAAIFTQVLRNQSSPSTHLDMVADGTGSLGNYCTPSDTGGNICKCDLRWTMPNGTTGQAPSNTTYQESNVVRCKYSDVVPTNAISIDVRIFLNGLGTYSNTLTFQPNGTGVASGTYDASQFVPVQRYLCRDIVTVPHLIDPAMYDPFQSEDHQQFFGLNFYTSNPGYTNLYYSSGGSSTSANWHCTPAVPRDPVGTGASLKFESVHDMDSEIYSYQADTSGYKLIYPPRITGDAGYLGTETNRSTFYLSRYATGIFDQVVNAYAAPGVITGTLPENHPPLGYGVAPIATGTDIERCPTAAEVPIPSTMHWVKVWLFRATHPIRSVKSSTRLSTDMGNLYCNPGNWTSGGSAGFSMFSDCADANAAVGNNELHFGPQTQEATNAANKANMAGVAQTAARNLAARIIANSDNTLQQCFRQNATVADASYATPLDQWTPVNGDYLLGALGKYSCGQSNNRDYLGLCVGQPGAAPFLPVTPRDADVPTSQTIDSAVRYDYIFVTTPTTVNSGDMKNSGSSVSLPYTPFRFKTPADCDHTAGGFDPYNTTNCPTAKRITYSFVANNVDVPGGTSRTGVFLVCALQPN